MEEEVRAVEQAYDEAWRAGNVDALLLCLTPDAVLVNPYGETASGHAEIRRELSRALLAFGSGSVHTSVVSRVELVTDEVAIVDGDAVVQTGWRDAPASELRHRFTDVLVRRDRRWLIAHIRAYPVLSRPDRDHPDGK